MTGIISFGLFILGLLIGSSLSAAIYRLHSKKESFARGRSKCPKCNKKLGVLDLIPLLSYMFLKGKCRYCKKGISAHYPLLELLTGLSFTTLYLTYGNSTSTILYILIIIFLIAILFEDLLYKEISTELTLPATIFALTLNITTNAVDTKSMFLATSIAILFFGGQILISKGKWIGGGDLKFGMFMGIFLGWQLFLTSIIVSYTLGAIVAATMLITKKANRKTEIPFGPFLIIGTLTALFYGEQIIEWYTNLIIPL